MDDEIKALLRDILQTQREHLKTYRECAERSLRHQEIALMRQKALMRSTLIAIAMVVVGGLLILWSAIASRS